MSFVARLSFAVLPPLKHPASRTMPGVDARHLQDFRNDGDGFGVRVRAAHAGVRDLHLISQLLALSDGERQTRIVTEHVEGDAAFFVDKVVVEFALGVENGFGYQGPNCVLQTCAHV